jgi:glycosyltransferase involved in cell wall biosynthesis
MLGGKRIIVVLPAYDAELTLEKTVRDIPQDVVDQVILCDDASTDKTVEIAHRLSLTVLTHRENKGYGANQKTCYDEAIRAGADIIAMIHPDYQYDPRVLTPAIQLIDLDICDVILGSRIRTRHEALGGGMPLYKYIGNRLLTGIENIALGQNLGDFHSGFRVYRRSVLEKIHYRSNSDDFIFDTELLAQAIYRGFRIGDVPVPTRYFAEASSINFKRSVKYGLGCLAVVTKYLLQKAGTGRFRIFS